MVKIPIPVPRLSLTYEFDIGTTSRPLLKLHDEAIKHAARELDRATGYSKHGVTADAFRARVVDGTSIHPDRQLSMSDAHNSPFDPNFHVAVGGPAIRYDFIYSDKFNSDGSILSSKLFLRVVTSFGKPEETIDGVTATRIGLTALEILEGNEIHPTIFPQHPPLQFGIRNVMNFIYHNIFNGLLAIPPGYMLAYLFSAMELLGLKQKTDITNVNNVPSMIRFHSSESANEMPHYHLYRSEDKGAFKAFLGIAEQWKNKLGLHGYFILMNFCPFVAPAMISNIYDISNIKERYRHAIAPAGPPPGADIWPIMNFVVAKKIGIVNYGVHKHNFTAKPVSFMWDWLHIRNSINLAAGITINGVLMVFFRGLPNSLKLLSVPDDVFSEPMALATPNVSWNKTMM